MTVRFEHLDGGGTLVRDHLGDGAPYTVTYTATARNFNGSIGETITLPPQTFGIDRRVADLPSITTPEVVPITGPMGCPSPTFATGCNTPLGQKRDPINMAFPLPGTRVIVSGTVTDPLTDPFVEDPSARYFETSGIAAVVVRLYNGSSTPNSASFRRSFFLPQDCSETHPESLSITRCPSSVNFTLDLTPSLLARNWYTFDIYAIDRAGLHREILSTQNASVENLAGPGTDSVAFFYAG